MTWSNVGGWGNSSGWGNSTPWSNASVPSWSNAAPTWSNSGASNPWSNTGGGVSWGNAPWSNQGIGISWTNGGSEESRESKLRRLSGEINYLTVDEDGYRIKNLDKKAERELESLYRDYNRIKNQPKSIWERIFGF